MQAVPEHIMSAYVEALFVECIPTPQQGSYKKWLKISTEKLDHYTAGIAVFITTAAYLIPWLILLALLAWLGQVKQPRTRRGLL